MIRMIQSSSAGHAKAYFSDALQKSDYYLDDQELQGRFLGRLAARIGLDEYTTKEQFFALCENIDPVTKLPLTPRTRDDRTIGYDINFHCPKSMSIVHALSGDHHILQAFQKSVHDTMLDIEADAMTRVRKNDKSFDRPTNELLWADFTHQTARPVDGSVPDPHLHAHCFVFNATWDEQEKTIKAGQFRDIKRDMPYYQARFHKRLSDNLIDLGYGIRLTGKSFEIENVPKGVIGLFSKRTNEIGEFAKEKGITDAKAMSELGARTRAKKQKGHSMAELKQEWIRQIADSVEYEPGERDKPIRYGLQKEPDKTVPTDCVDHAIQHSFERASVMADRRLLAVAYRHSTGKRQISLDGITDSFNSHPAIIHVKERYRDMCTTRQILAEEKHMVGLARQGQNRFMPLYAAAPEMALDGQQAEAVAHILTTSHQVSIIRGAAGSGKTKVMTEARKLINKAGKEVFAVAPTAQASRGVLVSEGFKDAETVAKLLVDQELQQSLRNQVLWVDEAGLLGNKDMTDLLELAQKQNTRLILGGDTRQHSSVIRGDALRILNTVAGIRTAEVSKIYRQQQEDYRKAVDDLSKGNVKGGFERLDAMGVIKEIDPLKPNDELVDQYVTFLKQGKSALIVSPTHQQGEAVTDKIRDKLRRSGVIGKKELLAVKYNNLNFTEAQKADWRNYQSGQVLQFTQNVPGIKRGSIWTVGDAGENGITIRNGQQKHNLPRDRPETFNLYHKSEIGLSKNDKVKITQNCFDTDKKRINNGQSLEVVSVSKSGKVVLQNQASKAKFTLDKSFGHIAHDYCTTSHSSQGKTVDTVFVSQPASTFSATDAKQFYVSVSRGRESVQIYTDDKEALLEHATRLGDRQSAIELTGDRSIHLDHVHQMDRNRDFSKEFEYEQPFYPPYSDIDRDYEPGF